MGSSAWAFGKIVKTMPAAEGPADDQSPAGSWEESAQARMLVERFRRECLPPEWQVQSIRQGRSDVATTGVAVAPGATIDVVITIGRR